MASTMKGFILCVAIVAVFVLTPTGAHDKRRPIVPNHPRSYKPTLSQKYAEIYRAYLDLKQNVAMCEKKYVCSVHESTSKSTSVECIPEEQRCDGTPHCENMADEIGCTPPPTPEPTPFGCAAGEYRCLLQDLCISVEKVCDGAPDCTGLDDENDCREYCHPGSYVCPDGSCIPLSEYCDGHADCPGGADEPDNCGCTLGNDGEPEYCITVTDSDDLELAILISVDDTDECKERCRQDPECKSMAVNVTPDIDCILFNTDKTGDFESTLVVAGPCDIPFYIKHCP